jgi:hypothetical protein
MSNKKLFVIVLLGDSKGNHEAPCTVRRKISDGYNLRPCRRFDSGPQIHLFLPSCFCGNWCKLNEASVPYTEFWHRLSVLTGSNFLMGPNLNSFPLTSCHFPSRSFGISARKLSLWIIKSRHRRAPKSADMHLRNATTRLPPSGSLCCSDQAGLCGLLHQPVRWLEHLGHLRPDAREWSAARYK